MDRAVAIIWFFSTIDVNPIEEQLTGQAKCVWFQSQWGEQLRVHYLVFSTIDIILMSNQQRVPQTCILFEHIRYLPNGRASEVTRLLFGV